MHNARLHVHTLAHTHKHTTLGIRQRRISLWRRSTKSLAHSFFLKQSCVLGVASVHVSARACTPHGWLPLLNATRLLRGFWDPPRNAVSCLAPANTQEVGLGRSEATGRCAAAVCLGVYFALRVFWLLYFVLFVCRVLMKINSNKISIFVALRYFALDWNDSWNTEKWMRCNYFETNLQLISRLWLQRVGLKP